MKGIKHECHECHGCQRHDGHDHGGGVRECGKVRQLSGGVTVVRECDSHQGGVKCLLVLWRGVIW